MICNTRRSPLVLALGLAAAIGLTAAARQSDEISLRQAILAAEDSRAPSPGDLQTLVRVARSTNDGMQAVAVRALGRLERPALVETLTPFLASTSAAVRAEAANAVGQAVSAASGAPVEAAGRALRDRLKREEQPFVRGVLAATLGRLPDGAAGDVAAAEAVLLEASWLSGLNVSRGPTDQRTEFGTPIIGLALGFGGRKQDAPPSTLLGVAEGLEALARLHAKTYKPSDKVVERLRRLATTALEPESDRERNDTGFAEVDEAMADAPVRIRRLALQTLVTAKAADDRTVDLALGDPDPQVRRLAILAAAAAGEGPALADALARGVTDDEAMVRLEALRVYGRVLRSVRGCGVLVSAVADVSTHVKLEAIDQLGGGCSSPEAALAALETEVEAIDHVGDRFWQAPAHALVSLARLSRGKAAPWLPKFAAHAAWQVRMYAARAAAAAEDAAALERLATDAQPNVREAAIAGLSRLRGHQADEIYRSALASDDHQLVRTAARALDGTPAPARAMPSLVRALARLTRARRDTSRDARAAIVETIGAIGSVFDAPALWPYLDDFDPRIAALAADTLTSWTGLRHAPLTTRFAPQPPPSWAEAASLEGARARFLMADGGAFELQLYPSDAPATVARFVRLARAGYYDGLTFHRVVPGFVIQGGSPGANEYAGDAAFMRDELGLRPHRRGAVGLSTRGRDTGDAQIFIDLIDNPRLDHDYTVFADVVRGMDAVDALLEGAVIERVEIVR